jgi:hypothetical protein
MQKYIWILLVFILCSISYSGTIDPNIDDNKYIEYGQKFKYVQKLCGSYKNNGGPYCASCVIIGDKWALTACHVVENSEICIIKADEKSYIIDNIICHENFKSSEFGYNDIALLHIKDSIILDFYPELYSEKDEVGKICYISGYGLTGNFNTGVKFSDDKRRAGSNTIDKIEKELLICSPSISKKTELEFLICSGDSGGGLFINNKLAGINSCVFTEDKKPDSNYGDESGHTRISSYTQWIKRHINEKK